MRTLRAQEEAEHLQGGDRPRRSFHFYLARNIQFKAHMNDRGLVRMHSLEQDGIQHGGCENLARGERRPVEESKAAAQLIPQPVAPGCFGCEG